MTSKIVSMLEVSKDLRIGRTDLLEDSDEYNTI